MISQEGWLTRFFHSSTEAPGPKLLLPPPYSPDFNPVEMAFSKLWRCINERRQSGPSMASGMLSAASSFSIRS